MMTAAVARFKAALSEFLSHVKSGEEVLVTEHGKPIAKVIPVARDRAQIPFQLLELERAGLLRIGTQKLPAAFWKLERPKDAKGLALKALREERFTGR